MPDPTSTDADKYRLDAQTHSGENIGQTPTHVLFVELKDERAGDAGPSTLGPS